MLTPSQAAKLAKVSKPTILRAIKNGKLSASRQENGGYLIDPAEVSRVFSASMSQCEPHFVLSVPAPEPVGARELIASLEHQLADLRTDRDAWRAQAERMTLALPAPAERGLMARLFGRKAA